MKLPSMQFYPGDWMKDPAVRSVSLAARGLWIDMLCLMHESHRRGYLQHATGKPVTPEQLARMTGCSAGEVSQLLKELEHSGVFSGTEHGVIYSRRMVKDEAKRQKCSEAGRRGGGNPAFKGHGKGEPKAGPKPGGKGGHEDEAPSLTVETKVPADEGAGSGEREGGAFKGQAKGLPEGLSAHPAVVAYWEKFRIKPPIGAQEKIQLAVTDVARWKEVLDYWEEGRWRPESIPKMLERYEETNPEWKGGEDGVSRRESASQRNARLRLESIELLSQS